MRSWATLITFGATLAAAASFAQSSTAPRPQQGAATKSAPLTPAAAAAIAAVEALGLEVESVDSVAVYSLHDIPARQRHAFSLGYTVGQIQQNPFRGAADGLGRQLDRLLGEGPVPVPAAVRNAAAGWARESESGDAGALGLADALQDALSDGMRATGAIEELFAKLGGLSLSIQTHTDRVFQLDVAERLYRVTGEAQYRAQADLQRLEAIEARKTLPTFAADAARHCRAVVPIGICREDIATAFENAGRLLESASTDEAQRALQPVMTEFLSR